MSIDESYCGYCDREHIGSGMCFSCVESVRQQTRKDTLKEIKKELEDKVLTLEACEGTMLCWQEAWDKFWLEKEVQKK